MRDGCRYFRGQYKEPNQLNPKSCEKPDPHRPTPHVLYRYRALIDDAFDEERLRPLFVNHQLYFPCRLKLNDPFECVVPSFLDTPPDILRPFLEDKVRKFRPNLTCDQIREKAAAIDLEKFRQDIQHDVDKVGILSLTEKRDDLLMWSHYANGHRGLCLEFAVSIHEPFFGRAQPVVYSGERSIFDPREPETKQVGNVVLTRLEHWAYELEWRIINHQNGEGQYKFPAETITGVIFGCWTSDKDKTKVQRWTHEGGLKLAIYQAKQKRRDFGLEIARIS